MESEQRSTRQKNRHKQAMSNPYPTPPPKKNRFKKGKSGNPAGRKPGTSLRTLLKQESDAEMRAIIRKAFQQAKLGDAKARAWIAQYREDPTSKELEIITREFTIKLGKRASEEKEVENVTDKNGG